MKVNRNILLTAAVILAASGCTKPHEADDNHTLPDSPIMLNATESDAATKALLNNGTFSATGNRILVYDYVDGACYFSDLCGPDVEGSALADSMKPEGVWPFENGPHQWTPGTHKFFGWLVNDANTADANATENAPADDLTPSMLFGETFDTATGTDGNVTTEAFKDGVLTIPATQMTPATEQFDFMYSNIVTTGPQADPVGLTFSHLFAAISFGVNNTTSDEIEVTDFSISGLYDTNSATVDFSGEQTEVVYGAGTKGGLWRSLENPIYLTAVTDRAGSLKSNLFEPDSPQQFFLMWPHDGVNQPLHSEGESTENADGTILYPDGWKMYIKYTADGQTYEKRINFPEGTTWKAGIKYHYTIEFSDKQVVLECKVNPWNYIGQNIDFADATVSIKENGALSWNKEVSNIDGNIVYIKNNLPAEGTFHLDTPVGGTWIATLSGDIDAFVLEPSTGAINELESKIMVKPVLKDPQRDYKVTVEFVVRRADGRTISADSTIQPTKYTIILPKSI